MEVKRRLEQEGGTQRQGGQGKTARHINIHNHIQQTDPN